MITMANDRPQEDTLLTTEEVAARLRLNLDTTKDWLRRGRLPGIKLGNRWRVRQSRLEEWIAAQEAQTATEHPPEKPTDGQEG